MQYIVLFFQQKISFTNNFTSINIKKAQEVMYCTPKVGHFWGVFYEI